MEAYLHGVSTRKVDDLVKALGVDSGISKSEVSSPDLRRPGRGSRRVPGPAADRHRVPVPVPGRHLLQGPSQPPRRVPGRGRRHRSQRRRPPGGPRLRRRRLRGRRVLDRVPAFTEGPRPARGAAGHLRRPPGTQVRDRGGAVERLLAALQGALPAQRPRRGAERLRRDVLAAIRTIFAQPDAAHVHEQFEVRHHARPPAAQGRDHAA